MIKEVGAQTPKEILEAYWNYQTVLYLALGYLPDGANKLTADSGKWNKVIHGLKERFPEFFSRVHFAYRGPLPLQSDQVDDFLFAAGLSDVFETTSPGYEVYSITDEVKARLQERRERRFSQEQLDAIREISQAINDELVVTQVVTPR